MKASRFTSQFVESIPETPDPGVLYVSMTLASAIHLCACGCEQEVITPLSPTDWKLCFDGENVTLAPSIGNWSFPCRSHYWNWIRGGEVRWSGSWKAEEIADGRAHDRKRKDTYFDRQEIMQKELSSTIGVPPPASEGKGPRTPVPRRVWSRLTDSQ